MFFRTAMLAAALALCGLPASAQSSLGVTAAEFALGQGAGPGLSGSYATLWVDTAITDFHGIQLDFAAEHTPWGGLGHVSGHLYLAPRDGQKYGLFATVGDLDGGSFTVGLAGLEGRFALGPSAAFALHGGLGLAHRMTAPERMDFLFIGGGVDIAASKALSFGLGVELAEFEEAGLQAVGYGIGLSAGYRPRGTPWALSADLGLTGLTGRDPAPAEPVARIGLVYRFGDPGPDPARGAFRRADPYAPMALRGMF